MFEILDLNIVIYLLFVIWNLEFLKTTSDFSITNKQHQAV